MNLPEYLRQREARQAQQIQYRNLCAVCLQPEFGCYCSLVQKFDPQIKFVILIHPIEVKRRIATGRMSHLCLKNSELIKGQDFSQNARIHEVLSDTALHPMILYPGSKSLNLSNLDEEDKIQLLPPGKTLTLFVIDGTWATAGRMIRQSQNLRELPRICFTPPGLSKFRVRKQPAPECLSTIEAIHHSIELLGSLVNFDLRRREHDNLLQVFDCLVERQLSSIREAYENPKGTSYRRPRRIFSDKLSDIVET